MNTNPELARWFPSDFLPSSVIAEYRRRLIVLTGVVALVMAASTAHANFVVFSVGGLHPGESALVAEQIFSNPNFGGLFDYEFLVFNTSLNLGPLNNFGAIDGFLSECRETAASALPLREGCDSPRPPVAAMAHSLTFFQAGRWIHL
jgi:hypothetical protein